MESLEVSISSVVSRLMPGALAPRFAATGALEWAALGVRGVFREMPAGSMIARRRRMWRSSTAWRSLYYAGNRQRLAESQAAQTGPAVIRYLAQLLGFPSNLKARLPWSGTTMSFTRNCGSLITSCGPRTAPNVTGRR